MNRTSLVLVSCSSNGSSRTRRFSKVGVLGIVRVRTGRHLRPYRTKPGIAQALESNFCCVVPNHRVITHELEKSAPALCHRLEFRFVGKFLEQGGLLLGTALH